MGNKAVITICGLIGSSWNPTNKQYMLKDTKSNYSMIAKHDFLGYDI